MSRYFCVSTGYFDHAKTLLLADEIGERAYHIPLRLFRYAALNQPDGDFSDRNRYPARVLFEIFRVCKKADEAEALMVAMEKTGWFEPGTRKMKGWAEWNEFLMIRPGLAKKAAMARWSKRKAETEDETPPEATPPSADPPGTKKAPNVQKKFHPDQGTKQREQTSAETDRSNSRADSKRENEPLSDKAKTGKSLTFKRRLDALNEQIENQRKARDFAKSEEGKARIATEIKRLKVEREATVKAIGEIPL